MEGIGHMLARFLLHFIAAAAGVLVTWAGLDWLWRRALDWSLGSKAQLVAFAVICALPVAAVPPLREAFDVGAGQSLVKAVSDYVSWYAGAAGWSWVQYRMRRGGF